MGYHWYNPISSLMVPIGIDPIPTCLSSGGLRWFPTSGDGPTVLRQELPLLFYLLRDLFQLSRQPRHVVNLHVLRALRTPQNGSLKIGRPTPNLATSIGQIHDEWPDLGWFGQWILMWRVFWMGRRHLKPYKHILELLDCSCIWPWLILGFHSETKCLPGMKHSSILRT